MARPDSQANPCLHITYVIQTSAAEIEARAEALLLEQTVELPRSAIRDPWISDHILGRVELIEPDGERRFRVEIAQPLATTARDPAQLLNLIFGNCSLQPDVMLADIELPDEAATWLPGPRLGIAGLRRLTGVATRPLLATALKPMGLDPSQVATLCRTFGRAGIDLVKDDHGLADHAFCPFEARVEACLRAVEDAARDSGHVALYVPNLAGTPDRVMQQLEFARAAGARAVVISPMVVGLPLLHQLASSAGGLPILAHPALGGVLRMEEPVLFGKLFRWYGADAVIFPHPGGRFGYREETCRRLADALRKPDAVARPALPVPAGGIQVDRVPELLTFYGADCMLLIGGSLYQAGDALFDRTKALVEAVARAASEGPAAA
jgi:ribulose-bisphosphate carboxylase large chain